MSKAIEVTAKDIQKGLRMSPNFCPIARAICRARKVGALDVYVSDQDATIRGVDFALPANARRFIQKFDQRGVVRPFTLKLKRENA